MGKGGEGFDTHEKCYKECDKYLLKIGIWMEGLTSAYM